MKTKPLYLMIQNNGDGSYSGRYTFDNDLIIKLQEAYDNGFLDYDDIGCDGDGFHYGVLNVPVECTAESLGIYVLSMDDEDMIDNFKYWEKGENNDV